MEPTTGNALDWLMELGRGLVVPDEFRGATVVSAETIPPGPRHLLVHDQHMTATLNRHYGQPVALTVLDYKSESDVYHRKILLTLNGGTVVEFGIVRLQLAQLPDPVRLQVIQRGLPLGEIFARHGVMTRVEPRYFLRFPAEHSIARKFDSNGSAPAFGRLALIHCNGKPAVELLEVIPA